MLKDFDVIKLPEPWRVPTSDEIKQNFKESAISAASSGLSEPAKKLMRKKLEAYDVHHIKPLAFGGRNAGNMALVDPTLHQIIHDQIDGQTKGMKDFDSATITLSVRKGTVWHLRTGPA